MGPRRPRWRNALRLSSGRIVKHRPAWTMARKPGADGTGLTGRATVVGWPVPFPRGPWPRAWLAPGAAPCTSCAGDPHPTPRHRQAPKAPPWRGLRRSPQGPAGRGGDARTRVAAAPRDIKVVQRLGAKGLMGPQVFHIQGPLPVRCVTLRPPGTSARNSSTPGAGHMPIPPLTAWPHGG